MSDLRTSILASDDLKFEDMTIPEWGGVNVRILGMSAEERSQVMALIETTDQAAQAAALLVHTMRDPETLEPIFTEADIPLLVKKSAVVIDRVAGVSFKVSGIGDETIAAEAERFPE